MKVEEPVDFDKQDPDKKARLFFSLAAVDHEQHLHNIQELMDALMNEELVNALLEAHTVEELQQAAQMQVHRKIRKTILTIRLRKKLLQRQARFLSGGQCVCFFQSAL